MNDAADVPSGEGSPGGTGRGPERHSPWAKLLEDAGRRLVPLLVSTGSLLTFVAFAGAVIVWTRLNAVEVASDQAITAFPRGELIAIGASLLLLFGFFGALAVLGAFLVDRGGRPTQGMAYGLLLLLTAEGVVALALAADFGTWDWVIAMLLFLFPVAVAGWVASLGLFSELRDELPSRPLETRGPERRWTILRPEPAYMRKPRCLDRRSYRKELGKTNRWVLASLLLGAVGLAIAMGLAIARLVRNAGLDELLWIVPVGTAAVTFAICAAVAIWVNSVDSRLRRDNARRREEEDNNRFALDEETAVREELAAQRNLSESRILNAMEERRMGRRRPFRLYLNWLGLTIVIAVLLLGAWLPALHLDEPWLGGALTAAAVICMWLWRIAIFTRDKVIWFGLAVFLSVPLFGTFMSMARNLDDPQIQPIALIRSSDRPDESIHGLYVTEAKDRVYFATVATEGCTGTLRENSGRLLWVPRDEVVAMSVGPLQSVQAAAKTSLEMAFALTPAVETPAGDSVSLTPGESRSEEGGLGEEAPLTVQRLENAGLAVRPTFGRGLELEPENAQAGEAVTLRMNTPIKDGFGARRDGRNVRVGGTPAELLVNPTRDAARAEFARTVEGRTVPLDKDLGLYVRAEPGGEIEAYVDQPQPAEWFVKLAEDSGTVTAVSDGESNFYLEIEKDGDRDVVADGQEVTFGDGEAAEVSPALTRQAWNKDEIKFYVPDRGATGTITVDCEQLAGEPLLRVERPPEADFSARLVDGGTALALDSHRSRDDGKIKARRWTLDGDRLPAKARGGDVGASRIEARADLAVDAGVHRIRLTVKDRQDEADAASLYVLRIPNPDALDDDSAAAALVRRRWRTVLGRLAKSARPTAVWVDGHGGGPVKGGGPSSLSSARRAFRQLMTREMAERAALAGGVPVILRAFGDRCDIVAAGGSRRHHVDIFMAGDGVRLLRPAGCSAGKVDDTERWFSEAAFPER